MHILLVTLSLHIPHAHSLKDKRREIKSIKDKLTARFNASVAEVDKMDSWQQSVLAVCMVSNEKAPLEKQFTLIETLLLEYPEVEVLSASRDWL